jgi:hypothetical protein
MITYTLKQNDGMGKCCSGAAGKLLSSFIAGECLPQETQGGEDFSSENHPAVDDCCRQLASGMIVLSFTWTTILRRSARSRQKYTLCKRHAFVFTQVILEQSTLTAFPTRFIFYPVIHLCASRSLRILITARHSLDDTECSRDMYSTIFTIHDVHLKVASKMRDNQTQFSLEQGTTMHADMVRFS